MPIRTIQDDIADCERLAAELAGRPEQRILEKIACEFKMIAATRRKIKGEPVADRPLLIW
jgi:hypothetical protein